ncbi:MAG: Na+/H+ antiporter NhaA [Caulobacteraceae bacterium]
MGRADGDGHRLRDRPDRHARAARPGGAPRLPDRRGDHRRHRGHTGGGGVLHGRPALAVPGRRPDPAGAAGPASAHGGLQGRALHGARRGAVGLPARGRSARDHGRGAGGRLHPDAPAAGLQRPRRPGRHHPGHRGAARPRPAPHRPVGDRAPDAGADPRPAGIAGRPGASPGQPALGLPDPADLRPGQRRHPSEPGPVARTRPAGGRHCGGPDPGKPIGFLAATALAVRLGLAEKPGAYSWRQLAGAGALAGIGFTMSLFIAASRSPRSTWRPRRSRCSPPRCCRR